MKKKYDNVMDSEEEYEWNQNEAFFVVNVIGKKQKNVRGVLILIILFGEFVL